MTRHWSVTAVIPTCGRPELRRAVESVLAQTVAVDVVVAADTADELDLPGDARVRVLRVGPRAGGNVARMAGIRAAAGELVALLDDDDRWRPDKLERQLETVGNPPDDRWLASCLTHEEADGRVWPRRLHRAGEPLADYLFAKHAVRGGQGALRTSTLLFPRSLALRHPWEESLRYHQDSAWLVGLDALRPRVRVHQVPEALAELGVGRGSVSRGISGDQSLAWARSHLADAAPRTRADFLLTVSYYYACRRGDVRSALRVLRTAVDWGRPSQFGLTAIATVPAKLLRAQLQPNQPDRPAGPTPARRPLPHHTN